MFRYTDWTGKRKQKKASGFSTKREALAFERDFMEQEAGSPSMTFANLWAIYKKDLRHRVKESSMHSVVPNVERRVLPYFQDMPINQITPTIVRRWETELHESTELADSFIRYLHGQLSSILSFACKYYSLPNNPAKIAGSTIKAAPTQQALHFWTVEQFKAFDNAAQGDEPYRTLFLLLFWSGLRVGEAFALTIQDPASRLRFRIKDLSPIRRPGPSDHAKDGAQRSHGIHTATAVPGATRPYPDDTEPHTGHAPV